MIPDHRHAGWRTLAGCLGLAIVALPASAQVPTASREELMRQWDINRDGKVDTGEAEIARSRMRRARNDAMLNSGTDPVTGRPRVATDPVTGRPRAATDPVTGRPVPSAETANGGSMSGPAGDDGLILVPGNGERPGTSGSAGGGSAAGTATPPRPPRRDRESLPGTRAPTMSSTIPSVSPRLPAGASSPQIPGASSPQSSGGRDPQSAVNGQERPQPGTRPGIIAGGARPGLPASRSVPGGGKPGDLNAGRLPGGLPQTRGIAPGSVATPRPGSAMLPNAGRLAGPAPSPGTGAYRGPTAPSMQSPSMSSPTMPSPTAQSGVVPNVPRPGVRQPNGGRPVTRTPNTVPRVPRMTTDEFYGR